MEESHDTDTYIQDESGNFFPDEETKLVKDRFVIINRYIDILEKSESKDKAIIAFKKDYDESKSIFTKNNDSYGNLFINSISCLFQKGLKSALSMWKEGVKSIEHIHEMDDLISTNPAVIKK